MPVTSPGSGLPSTGASGLDTTRTAVLILLVSGFALFAVAHVRRCKTTAPA